LSIQLEHVLFRCQQFDSANGYQYLTPKIANAIMFDSFSVKVAEGDFTLSPALLPNLISGQINIED